MCQYIKLLYNPIAVTSSKIYTKLVLKKFGFRGIIYMYNFKMRKAFYYVSSHIQRRYEKTKYRPA